MNWARSLIIVATLVLPSADSAPRSKDPPRLYFPVRLGTRLVYKWDAGDRTVEVVTAVEAKDGAALVTVCEEEDGKLVPASVVAVTASELRWIAYKGEALDRPVPLL